VERNAILTDFLAFREVKNLCWEIQCKLETCGYMMIQCKMMKCGTMQSYYDV